MRWDRLTLGIGFGYALLAWGLGFGAVLPSLRDEVSMSSSLAAMHGAMFGISLILFSSFGTRLFQAFSNRAVVVIGFAGMTAGGVLFGLGRTTPLTLAGATVGGLGAALFVIVVPSIVFAQQPSTATQAMSTLNAFPMLSATLLPIAISGAAAVDISWRFAYLAPVLLIASFMFLVAGRSKVAQAPAVEPTGLATILAVPLFARRWLLMVCGVLVELGTVTWAASIMREQGHASKGIAALLTVGFFVGMAAGRISLSHILRRFDMNQVIRVSFLGSLVSLVPFLLGPGLAVRVIGLTTLGLSLASIYPASITRLFELHHDTAALGRAAALASGCGVTFGPLLLGAISDMVGLGWATVVLPLFLLAGLLLASSTPLRRGARVAQVSPA